MIRIFRAFQILSFCCLILFFSGNIQFVCAQDQASGKLDLDRPIELAVRYLLEHCNENGRFDYIVQSIPEEGITTDDPDQYNQLRHAGAIYALAQAYHWTEQQGKTELQTDIVVCMKRAAGFMLKRIGPVPPFNWKEAKESEDNRMPVLALWSPKDEIDRGREIGLLDKNNGETAKLGGAGLALLSLCPLFEIDPDFVSKETLLGLGNFIDQMTLSDGSTIGAIDGSGRIQILTSLYSPGEAALGLCSLYQVDPDDRWLKTSQNILSYLAELDEKSDDSDQDHWPVQAAEALFLARSSGFQLNQNDQRIVRHACRIAQLFLKQQIVPENGFLDNNLDLLGCFNEGGRTCPTSTRLEALGAALNVLPYLNQFGSEDEQAKIRDLIPNIQQAQERGLQFLIRHQIQNGPGKGGMPPIAAFPTSVQNSGCIQIDFVQHFLSAMLRYEERFARLSTKNENH